MFLLVLLHFLKVIITAIISLALVIDYSNSPTRGIRRNGGRRSGGALDRRLLFKQEKETPYIG
jgi:hypothetical protein